MARWRKTNPGEGPQLLSQTVDDARGEVEDWYGYPNGWGIHAVTYIGSGLLASQVTARLVARNPHQVGHDAPGWRPHAVPAAPKWAGAWFGADGECPVKLNLSGLGMLGSAVASLPPYEDDSDATAEEAPVAAPAVHWRGEIIRPKNQADHQCRTEAPYARDWVCLAGEVGDDIEEDMSEAVEDWPSAADWVGKGPLFEATKRGTWGETVYRIVTCDCA